MNLAGLLIEAARRDPHSPALALGNRVLLSQAELARRAACLAGGLRQRFGLAPGERVAIAMQNVPAYLEALAAIWHAGLAAVPMNAKLHASEFAYMLEHSGARLCLATGSLAEAISPAAEGIPGLTLLDVESADWQRLFEADAIAPAPCEASTLAWLFYTSGTTGRPKGAMLTHANLRTMTACYLADVDSIAPGDSILHAAPLSHGSGIYALPHWQAGALQIVPESGGFDPEEFSRLAETHRGVSSFFAPTMVKRLVEWTAREGRRPPAGLKTIVYGGGPMYLADIERGLEVLGQVFVQIYGQGESPMCITVLPRGLHRPSDDPKRLARLASVGHAQLLCEVAIVDGEDRPLPSGEAGEIVVRGPSVMAGYWQNPEATAKTLAGGWLHTGDMGSLDEEGFLTLKDRSKDVIISGGTNIYPREIEEVLLAHPAVLECSVVGQPDPEWGEKVVAFVVARSGATVDPDELDRLCLDRIARFKRPKAYRLVDALPKNNYGKVLKTELRKLL